MKRNDSTARPRHIITVDCESTETPTGNDGGIVDLRFWFGCARYARFENGEMMRGKKLMFTEPGQFWHWAESFMRPDHTTWIWAHGASSDMTWLGLWAKIEASDYVFDLVGAPRSKEESKSGSKPFDPTKQYTGRIALSDPPFIVSLRNQVGARFVILDTRNFLNWSLEKLGKELCFWKLPMPSREADFEKWLEYCERDVAVLELAVKSLLNFCDEHNCGQFRFTLASLSMSHFRHNFCPEPPLMIPNDDIKTFERKSYYGGTFECFWLGDYREKHYMIDVNSLYPHMMHANQFPTYVVDGQFEIGVTTEHAPIHPKCAIAEVLIDTPTQTYPFRVDTRTINAAGSFWTTLAGEELASAVRQGHVLRFGRWVEYKLAPIFKGFVEYWWDQRRRYERDGKRLWAKVCKELMNTLAGKFGQRANSLIPIPGEIAPKPWFKWHERFAWDDKPNPYMSIGWQPFKMEKHGEHIHSFPAIASFITASARVWMKKARLIAGLQNVRLQACDAFIVNKKGLENLRRDGLIQDGKLGRFRIDHEGENLHIWGNNNYLLGDRRIVAGLKSGAKPIGLNTWETTEWTRLKQIIGKRPDGSIQIAKRIFRAGTNLARSNITPTGFCEPIRLTPSTDVEALLIDTAEANRPRLKQLQGQGVLLWQE